MAVVAAFYAGSARQKRYMRWHCDDLAENLAVERQRNHDLEIRLMDRDITIREIRVRHLADTQQPSPIKIARPVFRSGGPTHETDTVRGDPIGRGAAN
jgi:hypothetical protein